MILKALKNRLHNEKSRGEFVAKQLIMLPDSSILLDAGCGSQQYRKYCDHLIYKAQDFGQYENDSTSGFANSMGGDNGYKYGDLDYVGDIWNIEESDEFFDAILCTEVFEHIPYPIQTIQEFSRLLKPGGRLILTLPSNCLRHMDPYFFYSGFSDHWIEKILSVAGFSIDSIEVVGDYYSWMAVELGRTMKNHGFFCRFMLLPALAYYLIKRPTPISKATLCAGYHVVATKKNSL